MWDCPVCNAEHASGDYPDHWTDGCQRFEFECDCGATFEVDVEWEPYFHVLTDSVRAKAEPDADPIGGPPP